MKRYSFTSKGRAFAAFLLLSPVAADAAIENEFWYCDPKSPCYHHEPEPVAPPVVDEPIRPKPRPEGWPCSAWFSYRYTLQCSSPLATLIAQPGPSIFVGGGTAVARGGGGGGGGTGTGGSGGTGGGSGGGEGGEGGNAYAYAVSNAAAAAIAKVGVKIDFVSDKDTPPAPPPAVVPLSASGWFMVAGLLGLGLVARRQHVQRLP